MEANQIKAVLLRRLYEDGWGKGNLSAIDEAFASTHTLHWNELVPTNQHRTAEEVKRIVREYRSAFPDLQVTINEILVEGEKAAVQVTFVGTHRGPYEGFPPTNQQSRFTDMQILHFMDGKISESFLASGGLRCFMAILDGSFFTK